MTIYVDPTFTGEQIRQEIFSGSLIVLNGLDSVAGLVTHLRHELEALFAPHDPQQIHEFIEPAELAAILGVWKPAFIHSATAKQLVRGIISEAGFDPESTHYDVPKPRTSMPKGHLNTGIAFAFPWHRDVWYSAPPQQVNWWLPIYPAQPDNAMSFDPGHFDKPVPNDSIGFDYYHHNAGRNATATQVTAEVQSRPGAHTHNALSEVVVLPAPGGILLFSGAQLHTSIPNTSGRARYSVDFRTVDVHDVATGRGAPLVDAHCTGTAIRDFRNVATGGVFDEELVRRVFGTPPDDAMLVFEPGRSGTS